MNPRASRDVESRGSSPACAGRIGWKLALVTVLMAAATLSARVAPPEAAVERIADARLETVADRPITSRILQPAAKQQPSSQTGQAPQVSTVLRSGSGGKPRYAVPDFIALSPEAAAAARTIAEVLWSDLEFEREFDMIPRDRYGLIPRPTRPDSIPWDSWRELGADGVVSGTVRQVGTELQVQFRLFNVRTQQSVFAKEYTGSTTNPRLYAHTISDDIHQSQRALRGVARTKLAFVSDRRREPLAGTVEARSSQDVFVADYDGANVRPVTITRELNLNPVWSPDARAIAYTSYRGGFPRIVISFIREGRLQTLTDVQSNWTPMFSPDGTRIVFASNRHGNVELYMINVDGSNLRRLTNHPGIDISPTWSPTGQQVAFISDRSGRPNVYVMNADGTGNVQRLTSEAHADRPTWAPGTRNEIAFTARTGATHDIKVIDLATGAVKQLTSGMGDNEGPVYSPTGRHIAFSSNRSGRYEIWIMGYDGQGLRRVTDGGGEMPSWSN